MSEKTLTSNPRALKSVILAAGSKSITEDGLPVLLQELAGKKVIDYVMENVGQVAAGPCDTYVVVGYRGEDIQEHLGPCYIYVTQNEPRGTGHAVLQAQAAAVGCDAVLVLYGDMPLLRSTTLQALWNLYRHARSPLAMLVVRDSASRGFGRIIRDAGGHIQAIVEEAECTPEQRAIQELNPGVYCFDAAWLWSRLARLPLHADKGDAGEYFLTDLVAMAVHEGHTILDLIATDPDEALGINTPEHLAEAAAVLDRRVHGK